jgi:glycosyltransferase involved in cell wall biosynthesis
LNYCATIVVPLFRQVDLWLQQSVYSALAQGVPTEVIVVRSRGTPASNLGTLEALQQRWSNLVVLLEDKPGSFPAAINMGIRHASAERVGMLFSDDWLEESAVAECLPKSSDIVSTGHIVHFADGRINERACRLRSMTKFRSLATLEEKASYLGHFFLFRKKFVLEAGGLDENIGNYPGIDDFDLIWTLLEHNASVSIIERCIYHYRDHEGDRLTLSDPVQMTENLKKILRKHGVPAKQVPNIVRRHARWYGRPIYSVIGAS